jgi:hypothetical protein
LDLPFVFDSISDLRRRIHGIIFIISERILFDAGYNTLCMNVLPATRKKWQEEIFSIRHLRISVCTQAYLYRSCLLDSA